MIGAVHSDAPGEARAVAWKVSRLLILAVVLWVSLCGVGRAAGLTPEQISVWEASCTSVTEGLGAVLGAASVNEQPFVRVQLGVAVRGCAHPEVFESPMWFMGTLREFVELFVLGGGDWPEIRRRCPQTLLVSCLESMVRQHIYAELLPTIRVQGCGSQRDWEQVQVFIVDAAREEAEWLGWGAALVVALYRQDVRFRCLYPTLTPVSTSGSRGELMSPFGRMAGWENWRRSVTDSPASIIQFSPATTLARRQ